MVKNPGNRKGVVILNVASQRLLQHKRILSAWPRHSMAQDLRGSISSRVCFSCFEDWVFMAKIGEE